MYIRDQEPLGKTAYPLTISNINTILVRDVIPSILSDLRELLEKRASHPNHVELLGADDMLKEAIQEMGGSQRLKKP